MKIQPIEDRIVIETQPVEAETGGFYEHSKTKERPSMGKVVAVGLGKYLPTETSVCLIPINVKVGDTVLYGKNIGTEITVDGKDYIIMRVGEAFAIL